MKTSYSFISSIDEIFTGISDVVPLDAKLVGILFLMKDTHFANVIHPNDILDGVIFSIIYAVGGSIGDLKTRKYLQT